MTKFNIFFSIALLVILASCKPSTCANVICQDDFEDAFGIQFDRSAGQYSDAEIGTAYILQFSKTDTLTILDTIQQCSPDKEFLLGIASPGYGNFNYRITGTGTYPYRYWITDISINGSRGECDCYQNSLKKCKVNGVDFDRSGSTDNIILTK